MHDDDHSQEWELRTVRPVWHLLRRNRVAVIGVGLIGALVGALEALLLVIVVRIAAVAAGEVVDMGATSFGLVEIERVSVQSAFIIGGVGVLLLVLLQALSAWIEANTARREVAAARNRFVTAFLQADWPTQSAGTDGDVITTATEYAGQVHLALSHGMIAIVAGSSFLAMLSVAIVVDPPAAVAIALAAGGFAVLMRPLAGFSRRFSERSSNTAKDFTSELTRMLRVRRELVVFDVAGEMGERVDAFTQEHARWHAWMRFTGRMVPGLYRASVLAMLFVGLGAVFLIDVTNIPSLAAIVLILLRALNYTQTVQTMVQTLAEAEPPLRRLAQTVSNYDAARTDRRGAQLESIRQLELRSVHFSYHEDGEEVIHDLDLRLERGDVLGVIGPSGAGKSTLVDLVTGLRRPTSGEIILNGRLLHEYDITSLRRAMALVSQEPQLLRGSIEANVRFLRDWIEKERIRDALQQARLGTLTDSRGMQGEVGEHGSWLSGGQRQRLGIARALAGDPDLMILDEPTSALDVEAERHVVALLRELGADRITVVISHRPAALDVCDWLLVMRADGSHSVVAGTDVADPNAFLSEALSDVVASESVNGSVRSE